MPELEYWSSPVGAPLSDLGMHETVLRSFPRDLGTLTTIVQGLLVHAHWRERYGLPIDSVRTRELQLRRADATLTRVLELDPRPLAEARVPEHRALGVCRHISLMLCAFLRFQARPARLRCGFANYFDPQRWMDHWVCEVWDEIGARWTLIDPQLDVVQRTALKIDFDPLDVPRTRFMVAGEAWQRCRAGELDPQRFGIFDLNGLFFIAGNVIRDLAAHAKLELLPWDVWGPMFGADDTPSAEQLSLLDRAAEATLADDVTGKPAREFYRQHLSCQVPNRMRAVYPEPHEVDISADLR